MSESETSSVSVDILRVARAPVGGETDTNIENATRIVDPIPSVLEDYVEEIVDKADITNVEHGDLRADSEQTVLLDTIYSTDVDQEHLDATSELAKGLNERMNDGAGVGSLFTYRVYLEGPRLPDSGVDAVALVKMDTEADRRAYEDEDDDIDEIDEENAYPRSSRLQKGAIYPAHDIPPHSRDGDIKIYERSYSEYFRLFFDCERRIPSSLEESRGVLNACRAVIDDELDRQLTSSDLSEIIENRNPDDGTITKDSLTSAFDSISNGEIDEEKLNQKLGEDELDDLQITTDSLPKYSKMTISTANGDITVKYPTGASSNVQVANSKNSVVLEGDRIDYDYVDK